MPEISPGCGSNLDARTMKLAAAHCSPEVTRIFPAGCLPPSLSRRQSITTHKNGNRLAHIRPVCPEVRVVRRGLSGVNSMQIDTPEFARIGEEIRLPTVTPDYIVEVR